MGGVGVGWGGCGWVVLFLDGVVGKGGGGGVGKMIGRGVERVVFEEWWCRGRGWIAWGERCWELVWLEMVLRGWRCVVEARLLGACHCGFGLRMPGAL